MFRGASIEQLLEGVGILVEKQAGKTLAETKSMSIKVKAIVFKSNLNNKVVVNYATVDVSKLAEEHYGILTNVVNYISKHHVIVEFADFSVHLGIEKSV